MQNSDDTVLAQLSSSAPRRYFAVVVLSSLGGLLGLIALLHPPAFPWFLVPVIIAGVAFYMAYRIAQTADMAIIVTDTEVKDTCGVVLTRLDNIKKVERGAFAFKPSNGFVIVLKEPMPRHWVLGVWWRTGRRIGIGGTLVAPAAKLMSEQLALRIS